MTTYISFWRTILHDTEPAIQCATWDSVFRHSCPPLNANLHPAHLIPLPLGPFRITPCKPWPVMEPRGKRVLFLHLRRLYDRRPSTTLVHGRDLCVCYQFPHLGSLCKGRRTTLGDCKIMGISEKFNYGAQNDPDHLWEET